MSKNLAVNADVIGRFENNYPGLACGKNFIFHKLSWNMF